jgi:hypothetical protein
MTQRHYTSVDFWDEEIEQLVTRVHAVFGEDTCLSALERTVARSPDIYLEPSPAAFRVRLKSELRRLLTPQ